MDNSDKHNSNDPESGSYLSQGAQLQVDEQGRDDYPATRHSTDDAIAVTVETADLHTVDTPSGKRSQAFVACSASPREAMSVAESILKNAGYRPVEQHGEKVWKDGYGLLSAVKYFKITPQTNCLQIEVWIHAMGLKDSCLEGVVGMIPKNSAKATYEKIVKEITS